MLLREMGWDWERNSGLRRLILWRLAKEKRGWWRRRRRERERKRRENGEEAMDEHEEFQSRVCLLCPRELFDVEPLFLFLFFLLGNGDKTKVALVTN